VFPRSRASRRAVCRRTHAEAGPRPSVCAPHQRDVTLSHVLCPHSPAPAASPCPHSPATSLLARLPRPPSYHGTIPPVPSPRSKQDLAYKRLSSVRRVRRTPCCSSSAAGSIVVVYAELRLPFATTAPPPTAWTPPLLYVASLSVAHCLGCAVSSSEQSLQQPPPSGATEPPRRRLPCPNSGHQQVLGEHVVEPRHLPGWERRRTRRIPVGRAASLARGPNCKDWFLSRLFCVNQGHICKESKVSRDHGVKPQLQ
jgi:hypothetical protein